MKPYEFRSDVALADIAFYANGKTPAELIIHCCQALTDAMVERNKVKPKEEVQFIKTGQTLEELLYRVLEEVVYLKDSKQMVFHDFVVEKSQTDKSRMSITMRAKGERVDLKRHAAHADVKAVTYHDFGIEKTDDGYHASVTLDV